ncbi:MAG TPA: ATP-binding protein [Terriglobales bacterium]|nr:ATP-binding protein [Terriglobales bacterium]
MIGTPVGAAVSTASLKVHTPHELPEVPSLDPAILSAALEASPDPAAISENGNVLYANRRFLELAHPSGEDGNAADGEDARHTTAFTAGDRSLTLKTLRRGADSTDSQHLALLGRLVGGVTHDFNNLLTGILLYCDLLQSKARRSPLERRLAEIRAAAEHGANLIQQLMTVGREESSAPRATSLSRAVRDLLPLLRRMAGENIRVSASLPDGSCMAGISLAQAQQIIVNLALNARDAMPNGGSVHIEIRPREFEGTGPGERILELTVSDTGTGMDTPTASRVFEPFFTTKPRGRGTGLGLATVRKIVDDAGGIVCLETAPGKGTRMTVRLPELDRSQTAALPAGFNFESKR